MNKKHVIPNVFQGFYMGILSQFIADIVLTLLTNEYEIVTNDIKVSEIASYYAASASGAIASFLSIYLDPFAVVLFSTFTYAYVFEHISNKTTNKNIEIVPEEIIFDSGVIILLIYAFDPVAHNQYLRYQQKRHFIEPTYQRMDRSMAQSIFFIVLVNTYGFLKIPKN